MSSLKITGVAVAAATLIVVQTLLLGFMADIAASVILFGLGYLTRLLTESKP